IEKFGVALAIEGASFIGEPGRGLPFFPLAPVDDEHLIPVISFDSPDTDNAQKRLWLRADALTRKVDFERLCRGSEQQRREQVGGRYRKSSDVFADCHSWPPFFLTNCAGICGA